MKPDVTLLDKSVFERLYNRSLTNQELFEIKQNLIGFFNLLIKIDLEVTKNEQNN
jgi:hypothetical protein